MGFAEDVEDAAAGDVQALADQRLKSVQSLQRRLTAAQSRVADLERLVGMVDAYKADAKTVAPFARPKKRPKKGAATAEGQLSDLHLDEVVDPGEMGGLNAYSREIAELRLRAWADKFCALGEMHPHRWDGAVVQWIGDSVSGAIHAELAETNEDVLPGTIVHWAPLIAGALAQVADFYGALHVPVVVGNHGRMTKKPQAKKRARNNWDWLLAQFVATHLRDRDDITFEIAEGSYLLADTYTTTAFLTHGDEAGGGNGWAGVWSPLGTIRGKAEKVAKAHGKWVDYMSCGHWHQLILGHQKGIACNGSLKGWDEYAAGRRFDPEEARQSWWVTTPEHGVTIQAPVFVVDRKAEGW